MTEWCQHRDEALTSVRQGENTEFVEYLLPVGDCREQPIQIVLINPLWEECDDLEEITGIGSESLKHRRRERQLDRGCEAPPVVCLEHVCPMLLPFSDQPTGVPLVVMGDRCKQGDRQWMEVELLQDVVDWIRSIAVDVDAVERLACGLHRQGRNVDPLTVGREGGDPGSDAKADVAQLAELLDHRIYLLRARSLRIEYRFRIVEDDEHILGGQEWSKGIKIFWVFDPCPDGLGESTEKVGERRGEFVAADEPAILAKSPLDAIIVEDGQSNGCLANSTGTNESDWLEVFCRADDLLDQLVASK